MPDNTTITRDQLLTVLLATELGGRTALENHFSYADLGSSTYSFGQMQFDVGKGGTEVSGFLKSNGFDDDDVANLSKHGSLSRMELDALDAKLRAVPKDKLDEFTNKQLDKGIDGVDGAIERVRGQNAAAADAIIKDPKLQLGIADYENQFGHAGPQFVGFLAGNAQTLGGANVQAGNPPTREDIQAFIGATAYGRDSANARGVASRQERFDGAIAKLNLGSPTIANTSTLGEHGSTAERHSDKNAISQLQGDLGQLGYKDGNGQPLVIDGKLGAHTREALEKFQADQGFLDGRRVPPDTGGTVHAAFQAKVSELQDGLIRLGYEDNRGQPLQIDGKLGLHTRHALEKFQADHGMTGGGRVNPETMDAMEVALKPQANNVPMKERPGLDNPGNPHHAMFEQALAGVRELDAAIGRTSDQRSTQLAAAATAEAICKGLTRIDRVAMSEDGERTFTLQNTSPLTTIAMVPTLQALNTPMQQSNEVAEAAGTESRVKDQTQMQTQPIESQTQAATLWV